MRERENLEVGNNIIDADAEFSTGYCNGSLSYYDTNRQLPRPLTSETLSVYLLDNLHDQRVTPRWNVGFVVGWIAALCEHDPACFFTSLVMPESVAHTDPLPAHVPEKGH